jgi:hypothetical protein
VSGPAPIVSHESATFVATVSAPGGPAVNGGKVAFRATLAGSNTMINLCTSTVSNGTAQCRTTSLVASQSPYTVTATFTGNSDFFSPSSGSTGQDVSAASTVVTLTSSLNPSVIGQGVTYTASVSVTAPGGGMPSGSVTFSDGSNRINCAIGSQGFNGTTATCVVTYNDLNGNPHSITASYSGDADYVGSTSAVLSQVEDLPPTITYPTSTSPYKPALNSGPNTITVIGTNFESGLTVTANGAFTVTAFTFVDSQHVTVTLNGSGAHGATGNLTVSNPDGGSVTSAASLVNG